MTTENLIQRLAFDLQAHPRRSISLGPRLFIIIAAASIPSLLIILFGLSRSPHLAHGVTATIGYTVAAALVLAGGAFWTVLTLSRPEVRPRHHWVLVPIVMLAVGVAVEMARTPAGLWAPHLHGGSPLGCFALVSLLSLPILAGALSVLRLGAPAFPRSSGAMAGLLAGGIASALYTLHCPEDSLLFIGLWHVAAVLLVSLVGALAAGRLLRW